MTPVSPGLSRPITQLVDAAGRCGLPPTTALHRWVEDQGVLAALLSSHGWHYGLPLLELGCGLMRGASLTAGHRWMGTESDERLRQFALTLAPELNVQDRTVSDWPGTQPTPYVIGWDLWGRHATVELEQLMSTAANRLSKTGLLLLRWPRTGWCPDLDTAVMTESGMIPPEYGEVPRAASRQGLGAIRQTLHSHPGWVVWSIGPSLPIDRRHRVSR